ncbi:MAG: tetratricopeptide repeat protein, partial [candidate division KSB1 bacterium]|nr:tetratricopeptide repeat protein [candidate division KSB1 bacterium]
AQLGEANCLSSLGDLSFLMSDHEAARGYWEQALPLYRRLGAQLGEANCLSSLGDLSFRMSDHEAARGYYQQALSLYQAIGDQFSIAGAQASLARLWFAEGDIKQGEQLFGQAISYLESLPHYFNAAVFLVWQALGYPGKKYRAKQRACLSKAAEYFERAGNRAAAERCRREIEELGG